MSDSKKIISKAKPYSNQPIPLKKINVKQIRRNTKRGG